MSEQFPRAAGESAHTSALDCAEGSGTPLLFEQPPEHVISLDDKYAVPACSCGQMFFDPDGPESARQHADGSVHPATIAGFHRVYGALIEAAWRRLGRYLTAVSSYRPDMPESPSGARLVALDSIGAHFAWPDGATVCLGSSWLAVEPYETALAAWVAAAELVAEVSQTVGLSVPSDEAIAAVSLKLPAWASLSPEQRRHRASDFLYSFEMRTRRDARRAAASEGLGIATDTVAAALADMYHRTLWHPTPTGEAHIRSDLAMAARYTGSLIPPGWKLVRAAPEE